MQSRDVGLSVFTFVHSIRLLCLGSYKYRPLGLLIEITFHKDFEREMEGFLFYN